jgi:hypothetical protein
MEGDELTFVYKGVYVATLKVIDNNIIDTINAIDNNQ